MATGNAINANSAGLASYDGSGIWAGRTIVAGDATVTVTNGDGIAGNPSLKVNGGGVLWVDVTAATQSMAIGTGYTANRGTLVTFTLPAVAAIGDVVMVAGLGAGGWSITENASQLIHIGSVASTVTTGSVSSTNQFDSIILRCIVANTTWTCVGAPVGNLTVV